MNQSHNPNLEEVSQICQRPLMDMSNLSTLISDIFENIQEKGDAALLEYTARFDRVKLERLLVSESELNSGEHTLTIELKSAIQNAYQNIHTFHNTQLSESIKVETQQGVMCWQQSVPILKVGLYIPGGTAPLFSTVLMLSIPAIIAGCEEIILCTPPNENGQINPAILYTAKLCGVTKIVKAGGAQAIAALALGTETVPKVDKIFGPGNQYVTAAKQKAFELGTAIDMPAGPSEVLVYADETAKPASIAADLLAQAEHGVDSQVIFVTTKSDLVSQVLVELESQQKELPRQEITKVALEHSHAVSFDSLDVAFDFINDYAPEHLIICSDKSEEYLTKIKNAGSVFLGNYTPESAGDYASGTNHTLPTNGHAKAFSGVNLDAFVKKITFQKISQEGLVKLGDTIIVMAEAEHLQAHANAVKIRIVNS